MWPGQQPPGGEQNPQDPNRNPYQQPGYQQPNPYQQPGYQQPGAGQPNPYAQPGGPQPGGPQPGGPQWTTPAAPFGPLPPEPPKEGRNKHTTVIAIAAAVAVVAAAAVAGVVVLDKKDGGKDDKQNTAHSSDKPSASASASASSQAPEDNPRSGGEVKPVIDGWKVVVNPKRHDAFDVPADWQVDAPDMSHGFEDDKGQPLVMMTAAAYYKMGECAKDDHRAGTGTKGAQGAKSPESAAEIEAKNWVLSAFDQKQTGHLETTKAQSFKSDHGLTGAMASATVTGVDKNKKCMTDGKSFAVTYKDSSGDLATWVLYAGTGFDSELKDDVIKKIMSTLRPLPS